MEPAMGVEMLGELKKRNGNIKSLTMDNDSTTIQRVRALHGQVSKLSDTNHTKKGIVSALYELNTKHKELKNSKTVNYIAKLVMYGIQQKQKTVKHLCPVCVHV